MDITLRNIDTSQTVIGRRSLLGAGSILLDNHVSFGVIFYNLC